MHCLNPEGQLIDKRVGNAFNNISTSELFTLSDTPLAKIETLQGASRLSRQRGRQEGSLSTLKLLPGEARKFRIIVPQTKIPEGSSYTTRIFSVKK